jgi:RimJ/RimL family protein N-acetyltransferase
VGWGLIREAHGHGLAHEAAVACIDFAVDRLGWTQVIHCIDPENHSSARLAQRLGARVLWQQETPAPFAGMVWNVWGQDAGAWRARRGAITPA